VTATAGGASATQTIIVGGTSVPAAVGTIQSASVSANPSVVATNSTSTINRTEIRALFVGANNAPIKNVRVKFDLNGDVNSIGGSFSTGANVVYTDDNGIATTAYVPGTRSSPTNGVTIRACYDNVDFTTCTRSTSTTITVASDPLSVSIGTNNLIVNGPNQLTYIRQYVVLVVDASGRAKANVNIVPSIDLDFYYKGRYVNPGAYTRVAFGCINEDRNRNGILETSAPSEDLNHSDAIEPRKSDATITILGNGQTDANGSAIVQVEYPQNVASWLHVNILVSATGVSGTEGRATWPELLPVPVDALTASAVPPFVVSPYGTVTVTQIIDPTQIPGGLLPDGTLPSASAVDPCHNPY